MCGVHRKRNLKVAVSESEQITVSLREMMLRSSSTPILGSLLSSFSESPNRDFENNNKNPLLNSEHLKKISFSHGGNLNFSSFSCYPSPLNRSSSGFSDSDREIGLNGFRRVQSDGNLEGLAGGGACDVEEFHSFKSLRRNSGSMLQTIPSFSIFNSSGGYEDEEDLEEEEDGIEFNEGDGFLERSVTIGDSIMAQGSGEFSFGKKMDLIEEEEGFSDKLCYLGVEVEEDGCRPSSPPMFLARGLGIDVGGFGGGGGFGNDFNGLNFGEGGENESKTGEYYKKMVEEHPCSALFLRNYAQFLYKTKHDLWGADEYYSRAILADPQDGEILSQYAKLVWELHHDHERASSYFERAVQAAPEDSHVHAAYASFLWETEDIEEEVNQSHNYIGMTTIHTGVMASATA